MLAKDIKGHEEVKQLLDGYIKDQKIPHALLFTGPTGNGKLAMALALATAVQCKEAEGLEVCGVCSNCVKSLQYIHPDIHFAVPVIKHPDKKREDTTTKDFLKDLRSYFLDNVYGGFSGWMSQIQAENKPFNINKAECLEIIKGLSLKKYEGEYKVQIIWIAELLGKEGNRLLKLIEEPTPDTIILLISEKPSIILNTIISRCQIVNIPPFSDDDIVSYLSEKGISGNALKEVSRLANGSMIEALKLNGEQELAWDELLLDIFRASYTMSAVKIGPQLERITVLGKNGMVNFCNYTLHFLREYLKAYNLKTVDGCRLSSTEKNTALRMMQAINHRMAVKIVNIIEENIHLILRNANARILWEDSLFRIGEIMRNKTTATAE